MPAVMARNAPAIPIPGPTRSSIFLEFIINLRNLAFTHTHTRSFDLGRALLLFF